MGKRIWALNVISLKLGDSELTTSKRTSDDTEIQVAQGVIDSTTRFIWVSEYV
jgi:hypothetical protein